jgi:predicted ATPase
MNKRWTLHVENFGKIKQADIEISPLMLFVGDNNSGKSYLMSLLWGLLTIGTDMFSFRGSNLNSYIRCEQWLMDNVGVEVDIKNDTQYMFIEWFNDLLEKNKKSLTNKIFNYPIDIGKIEIRNYSRTQPLKIQWKEDALRFSSAKTIIKFPYKSGQEFTIEERSKMLTYICWNILMDGITAPLFPLSAKGKRSGEPVYLPASRTGFMLSYKSLIRDAISRGFSPNIDDSVNNSVFTLPVNYFLQDISRFQISKENKYGNVADFIEEKMLNGKVIVDDMPVPNVSFQPKDLRKNIPLHITSSVVSELAPVVLLLKSSLKYNLLIIEEPEAHLHPKYQVLIVKAIIRLVNTGLPVWISTHSDIILQQINNMIKLNKHTQKETLMNKFNYEKKDLLDESKVNIYQFNIVSDRKTEIQKLTKTEYEYVFVGEVMSY